jgi:uncharacterized membrane protein
MAVVEGIQIGAAMDGLMIIARLVHVVGGAFWVGAMIFVTFFLAPAVREAGPDGGKVMGGIAKRNFMALMPAVAIFTILSGIYLYWRVSAGFNYDYMKSGPGHAYAMGGILAILAFVLGLAIVRPAMMKAMALMQSLGTAAPGDRERIMTEADKLRDRSAKTGFVVAWMLILAVAAMAVGRYV